MNKIRFSSDPMYFNDRKLIRRYLNTPYILVKTKTKKGGNGFMALKTRLLLHFNRDITSKTTTKGGDF